MADDRVPGRAPVLLTTLVQNEIRGLTSAQRDQLLATLEFLRYRGLLPHEQGRVLDGRTVRAASASPGVTSSTDPSPQLSWRCRGKTMQSRVTWSSPF
jgi:hypothetical protein